MLVLIGALAVTVSAQRSGRGATGRVTTEARCAADLGTGVKTKRAFCDVLVANTSVIQPGGEVVGRAAVVREFRAVKDLFDQIGGGSRPGGIKAVAPGPAEAVRFTIPAGVSTIGLAGVRLRVLTRAGEETFEAPGRPVAIVSNLRIQYTPAR
jgi:hypothetical protein